MIEIQWNPPVKQLRYFATVWFPLFCILVGWFFLKGITTWTQVFYFWGAAGLISATGVFFPTFIKPVYVFLSVITYPIGWAISHSLLVLLFYIIVTPTGMVLKLFNSDPLRVKQPKAGSMWEKTEGEINPARYLKQY